MPFEFIPTALEGVVRVRCEQTADSRGAFMECYKRSDFERAGLPSFVQDNESRSSRHTLRGLHFQRPPEAQAKLIRVTEGEIFDVAVDLRRESPDFGRWQATRLSASRTELIFIPSWCAHGFCVLSEFATVFYKTTREYSPASEDGICWNDPSLGIEWPTREPVLSERDRRWPHLDRSRTPF